MDIGICSNLFKNNSHIVNLQNGKTPLREEDREISIFAQTFELQRQHQLFANTTTSTRRAQLDLHRQTKKEPQQTNTHSMEVTMQPRPTPKKSTPPDNYPYSPLYTPSPQNSTRSSSSRQQHEPPMEKECETKKCVGRTAPIMGTVPQHDVTTTTQSQYYTQYPKTSQGRLKNLPGVSRQLKINVGSSP
jgi:hypothetical protein